MSDGIFVNSSETPHPRTRLAALVPLAAFLVVGVFLAAGLTLNPREIPSPLIGKPVPETFVIDRTGRIAYKVIGPLNPQLLQDKILPLIRELRK